MKNKAIKQELVLNDKYDAFCWNVHLNRLKRVYEDNAELYGLTDIEFEACNQLRDAKNKAWSRIYQHIRYFGLKYGFKQVFFITLTFNDDALSLKDTWRRKLINELLRDNCDDFICNIDYGKLGDREHYHAVIVPKIDKMPHLEKRNGKDRLVCKWLDDYRLKYGYYSIEDIKTDDDDVIRVGRYIAKLSNHSIKVKQSKIMTKKDSDYQHWKDKEDKTRYHLPIKNTRDSAQQMFYKLSEVFGEGNFDIV